VGLLKGIFDIMQCIICFEKSEEESDEVNNAKECERNRGREEGICAKS